MKLNKKPPHHTDAAAFCYMVGGAGFEPTKAEPTDLQSAPFDRFGIPPDVSFKKSKDRGD
jgi:hypothetical protein